MSTPVEALCSTKYTAVHSSGVRDPDVIIWIVLHSTEGATAESAARWFANPKSTGSTHLVVDDDICYRCLRNVDIPWGASGANKKGFHIEQAGYARWSNAEWKKHDKTIRRAAYKTALHAHLFDIPLRWVGVNDLKAGKPGVTTHSDCSRAFGGDHTDPGSGYPKWLFLKYAKQYLLEMEEV